MKVLITPRMQNWTAVSEAQLAGLADAGATEVVGEHLADFPVVLDDGDARHPSPRCRPRAALTIETKPPRLGNRLKHSLMRVGARCGP